MLTRSSRKLNVLILIALIGLIVAASLGYGAMQMDSWAPTRKCTDWASRLASWAFSFFWVPYCPAATAGV